PPTPAADAPGPAPPRPPARARPARPPRARRRRGRPRRTPRRSGRVRPPPRARNGRKGRRPPPAAPHPSSGGAVPVTGHAPILSLRGRLQRLQEGERIDAAAVAHQARIARWVAVGALAVVVGADEPIAHASDAQPLELLGH